MGDRLTEEQRMMQRSCRDYVDEIILPFIRDNWRREWNMSPEARLPPAILQGAEEVGVRTLGIPEEYGGIELDPATEVQTGDPFALPTPGGDFGRHARATARRDGRRAQVLATASPCLRCGYFSVSSEPK